MWVSDLLSGLSLITVIIIGCKTIRQGRLAARSAEQAARGSDKAAAAAERTVELANRDAYIRRVTATFEVVLEMRQRFNESKQANSGADQWAVPEIAMPLCWKLEGCIAVLPDEQTPNTATLTNYRQWSSNTLELARNELKQLLYATGRQQPQLTAQ